MRLTIFVTFHITRPFLQLGERRSLTTGSIQEADQIVTELMRKDYRRILRVNYRYILNRLGRAQELQAYVLLKDSPYFETSH